MADRGNTWELPVGDTQAYNCSVVGGNGQVITGQYVGTEPLTTTVWEGSNLTALPGVLTAAWVSGPAGTTIVQVNGGATAGLTTGYYRTKLEVTYGGATSPYFYGLLHLLPIGGLGTEQPTYNALQDLLDKAVEWLPRLMQDNTETNFVT